MRTISALSAALFLSLLAPSEASAQARCLSAYGRTQCGYGCVADYGQIQCAQTPYGACASAYGRIVCWDPPDAQRFGYAARTAVCRTEYGRIVCGFDCVAAYGQVQCAQTPYGACITAYGRNVCWDPPATMRAPRTAVDPARCLAEYGQITCGFGCVAAYGRVHCAQTPGGVCSASYGRVTCWEPPG